jgi:hypothetical protein
MAKPVQTVVQRTHDRLRNHYGNDIKRAIDEIVGETPKKPGQGAGFPSEILMRNVFYLGEAASAKEAIPRPDHSRWNGWDALIQRMSTVGIP